MAKKRKVRSTPQAQPEEQQQHEQIEEEQIEDQEEEQIEEEQVEEQIEREEEANNEEEEANEEQEEKMDENKKDMQVQVDATASNGGDEKSSNLAVEEQEPVEKLIEPFSKEQLAVLLKEAVAKYPELIESVQKLADADPAHHKIFVHGLGWDTTAETLTYKNEIE